MESLRRVASELSIPERTLRRAAADGLVRGQRVSPRRFRISFREEAYLRSHWELLRALRGALRTEPNVRLALLFGSTATGRRVLVDRDDLWAGLRKAAQRWRRLARSVERSASAAIEGHDLDHHAA
jgi:hypothetical protein